MIALLRYQAALLLGSHRWLPPVILYAGFLVVGIGTGSPVLDAFGFTAAALLPLTIWLTRVCVTNEPPAARSCLAAAVGPGRAHLAAVLTAALAALPPALAGTAFVALFSDPRSNDHQVTVDLLPATACGLAAAVVCLLLGTAAGAACNRPVLRGTAWPVCAGLLSCVLLVVPAFSPAGAVVRGLVMGSVTGTAEMPWLPLSAAIPISAAAVAAACRLAGHRG
ncbi:ABC transporter [Streptomyces sp. NPDC002067]